MARLNVNSTRMKLSKLKTKLTSARRGHKLLKDKRDELMRQFMNLIKENRQLRSEVEAAISTANKYMAVAGSVMQREVLETALMLPKQEVELEVSEKNVMSVNIPVFSPKYRTSDANDIYSYGTAFTSIDLDGAVASLSEVFPKMIRLAEIEKACQLMADEIEKTRRRVNALEHIMIPDYEETIKFITMKLSENERSTTTSLMKV
ncbi:MAG: V-type ATP synthase subunit D, partial [Ruminococcus sp.]|nr:V-type ATP synthase subunit D [Ruminococcus sp.]